MYRTNIGDADNTEDADKFLLLFIIIPKSINVLRCSIINVCFSDSFSSIISRLLINSIKVILGLLYIFRIIFFLLLSCIYNYIGVCKFQL